MTVNEPTTSARRHDIADWRRRNRLSPPRQQIPLCPRTRLLRSLNLARSSKLSLLIAPAGYGKTTVLSQWTEQLRDARVTAAWCKLTANENEPGELLRLIARSLHFNGLDMSDTGLLLDGDIYKRAALDTIALKLERATHDIVIILDDFESVQDAASAAQVDELLDLLPAHAHLVIATRRNPALQLAMLRTQGNLRTVGAEELALNKEEIGHLLGKNTTAEELTEVENWTRGWPAAVQLYRSWREQNDGHGELPAPFWPTQPVTDYLAEQVFNTLSETQKQFIAEVSILEEIEPRVADHLRECDDSLAILHSLRTLLPSLVEVAQPGEQTLYRYHPLLAEAIHTLLPLEQPRLAVLHKRASEWFLQNERVVEAMRHAVASESETAVARIIRGLRPLHFFLRGGIGELKAIAREIPRALQEKNPRVRLMLALIHFKSGFCVDALKLVEATTAAPADRSGAIGATGPEIQQFETERLALYTMFRIYLGHCDEHIDSHLEQLRDLTRDDPLMWAWRVNLMVVIHEQRGELRQSAEAIEQCADVYDIQRMPFAGFQLMTHRLILNLARGSLREVSSDVGRILKQRREQFTSDVPVLAMTRLAEAAVAYERRPSEALEEAILQALEQFGESESWFEQWAIAAPVLADIASYRGGTDAVGEFTAGWSEWAKSHGVVYLDTLLPAIEARYLILANRLEDAAKLIRTFAPDYRSDTITCLRWREREAVMSTLALYHLASGDYREAQGCTAVLVHEAENRHRLRGVIAGRVLTARVHAAKGETAQALAHMLDAVRAAHPEGYVFPFTEAGREVRPVLEELCRQEGISGLERQHLEHIIQSFSLQPSLNPHDLSQREVEILRHLADGASNKLIARRIGLSDNTVKYHLKSAFQKLGVSSRKAASAAFEAERDAGYYP